MRLRRILATCWRLCLQWLFMEERRKIFRLFCQCHYHVKSVTHGQGGVGMDMGNIIHFENVKFSLSCTLFFLNVPPHGCRVQTLLCICKSQILSVLENNFVSFFFSFPFIVETVFTILLDYISVHEDSFPLKNEWYWPQNAQGINETLGLQ